MLYVTHYDSHLTAGLEYSLSSSSISAVTTSVFKSMSISLYVDYKSHSQARQLPFSLNYWIQGISSSTALPSGDS